MATDLKMLPFVREGGTAMVFIDGENLTIRMEKLLDANPSLRRKAEVYQRGIYVWSKELAHLSGHLTIIRRHYYTSLTGSDEALEAAVDALKGIEIEVPRVFKKLNGKTKMVDISLATDMLLHACHRHYDVAILVAGDKDYVPLVRAVQREGALVHLWFYKDAGLSPDLRRAADRFNDLTPFMVAS